MWLIIGFCMAIFALVWVLSRDSKRADDGLRTVQSSTVEPFTVSSTFHGDLWHLAVDAERKKIALIRLNVQSTRPPHTSCNDMNFVLPLASVAEVRFEQGSVPADDKGAATFHITFNDWPDSRWFPNAWAVVMVRDATRLKSWIQNHVGIEPRG